MEDEALAVLRKNEDRRRTRDNDDSQTFPSSGASQPLFTPITLFISHILSPQVLILFLRLAIIWVHGMRIKLDFDIAFIPTGQVRVKMQFGDRRKGGERNILHGVYNRTRPNIRV